jgi:hypothetical protein
MHKGPAQKPAGVIHGTLNRAPHMHMGAYAGSQDSWLLCLASRKRSWLTPHTYVSRRALLVCQG